MPAPELTSTALAVAVARSRVRHPDGTPPPPYGCRWCGIHPADHRARRTTGAGLHTWEQPTPAQLLARMRARRTARAEARRLAAVEAAFVRAAGLAGPAERRRRTRAAAQRACTTCEYFLPAMPAEEQCNTDGCGCTGYPAACDIHAAPAGAALPLTGCPRWQAPLTHGGRP
ncbi:hypothetical protein [Streptomyces olivaceus]|uniref:hypothetical protein n=1 Tax=Streptomyces olivaceus TaxID=47716 RepID=UPI00362F0B8F